MGKTLSGILSVAEVIGAVAVQFIPGLNVVAGVTLGVSLFAAGAQGLYAQFARTPKPANTSTALKSPTPPRFSAYGMTTTRCSVIL